MITQRQSEVTKHLVSRSSSVAVAVAVAVIVVVVVVVVAVVEEQQQQQEEDEEVLFAGTIRRRVAATPDLRNFE